MDEEILDIVDFQGREDFIKFLKENMSIEHDKLLERLLYQESMEKAD